MSLFVKLKTSLTCLLVGGVLSVSVPVAALGVECKGNKEGIFRVVTEFTGKGRNHSSTKEGTGFVAMANTMPVLVTARHNVIAKGHDIEDMKESIKVTVKAYYCGIQDAENKLITGEIDWSKVSKDFDVVALSGLYGRVLDRAREYAFSLSYAPSGSGEKKVSIYGYPEKVLAGNDNMELLHNDSTKIDTLMHSYDEGYSGSPIIFNGQVVGVLTERKTDANLSYAEMFRGQVPQYLEDKFGIDFPKAGVGDAKVVSGPRSFDTLSLIFLDKRKLTSPEGQFVTYFANTVPKTIGRLLGRLIDGVEVKHALNRSEAKTKGVLNSTTGFDALTGEDGIEGLVEWLEGQTDPVSKKSAFIVSYFDFLNPNYSLDMYAVIPAADEGKYEIKYLYEVFWRFDDDSPDIIGIEPARKFAENALKGLGIKPNITRVVIDCAIAPEIQNMVKIGYDDITDIPEKNNYMELAHEVALNFHGISLMGKSWKAVDLGKCRSRDYFSKPRQQRYVDAFDIDFHYLVQPDMMLRGTTVRGSVYTHPFWQGESAPPESLGRWPLEMDVLITGDCSEEDSEEQEITCQVHKKLSELMKEFLEES